MKIALAADLPEHLRQSTLGRLRVTWHLRPQPATVRWSWPTPG